MFKARHFRVQRCVCRWTVIEPNNLLGSNYSTYNGSSFRRRSRRSGRNHDHHQPPYSTGQNRSVDSAADASLRGESGRGRAPHDSPWASKESAGFTFSSRNLHTERLFKHNPEIAQLRRYSHRRSQGLSDRGHTSSFGHTHRPSASGAPPPTPGAQDYYLAWLETQLMHGLRMESKTTFRYDYLVEFL